LQQNNIKNQFYDRIWKYKKLLISFA